MAKKNEITVGVAEVVDYMRLNGQFAPALSEVAGRKITAKAAKKSGIKVTAKELQKAADTFRSATKLDRASDTKKWLQSNGLSLKAFEDFLQTNLLITKFKDALEKKTDKKKYLASRPIQDSVRQLIYDNWLNNQM